MMKSQFIMLMGLPGSGKSTWAVQYRRTTDPYHEILSTDDYVEAKAKKLKTTYDAIWKDTIKEAQKCVWAQFEERLRGEEHLIWDQTNLTVKKREGALSKIPSDKYLRKVIFFDIRIDLIEKRLKEREALFPGKTIPPSLLYSMFESLEPPTFEEGWDIIEIRRV